MAEYIYTVKDRETGEILCRGSSRECAEYIGCEYTYVRKLVISEGKTNSKYYKYNVERMGVGNGKRGGDHRSNIICCDCGILMENVNTKRKRCPECAKKHANAAKRDRMRRLRETGLVVNPCIKRTNHDGCEDCIYFFGEYDINKCCNYILVKGERRPCPPGKECTVKVARVHQDMKAAE